jgi:hypothetical protein
LVAQLGGVSFPSIVRGKLALRIVISQLRKSDGLGSRHGVDMCLAGTIQAQFLVHAIVRRA